MYLVKKSFFGKYKLVNITIELNQIIIRDANLSFFADKFSEKCANYIILSFIDFFSSYNQVEFDEKSRDLTGFMISLYLIWITTLS